MTLDDALARCNTPLKLCAALWPNVKLYRQQREIACSVRDANETYVMAGNQLGKDFVAGFVALSFFLRPQLYFDADYVAQVEARHNPYDLYPHTRRVVTTSVAEHHLKVLWGEIGRWATTSVVPLVIDRGGPLVANYQELRWARERDAKNPLNYLVGRVSAKGEGMAGHHAAYTLLIVDEASGVDDSVYSMGQGWAKRFLIFGNPNQCENFFRRGVKGGDHALAS